MNEIKNTAKMSTRNVFYYCYVALAKLFSQDTTTIIQLYVDPAAEQVL